MCFSKELRVFICFLAGLIFTCFSVVFPIVEMSHRVMANTTPDSLMATQIYSQGSSSVIVPDWSALTFAALPAIAQDVEVTAPTDLAIAQQYNLSRDIRTGMTPDQYLKLGDFQDSLYLQNLTLQGIASGSQAQYDISQVALNEFDLLQHQTVNELAQAIPGLESFAVSQIPPLETLLKSAKLGVNVDRPLSELLQGRADIGNLKLGKIKLDQFSINDIPGLKDIPLENLQHWQDSLIHQVPGLKDLPFSQFPASLVAAGAIGVIDMAYGAKESNRVNTISGSDAEGFQVPCRENCAYTELSGVQPLYGKQWISGKYQQVKGGHGPLAIVNGGKEPTGRHPFGKAFKVVIWDVDESAGRVDTALFFRMCHRVLGFGRTCTPYFIGPIPFMSYHEKSPILVGLLDNEGGATTGVSIPQDAIDKARAAGIPLSEDGIELPDSTICGSGAGGVDFGALAAGISGIEGGYSSSGYYDPEAGGRGLGRYQYMTFRNDVRAIIAKHPGGSDFLRRADVNDNSSAYIAALDRELPNYFTQSDQDALFKQDQAENTRIAMQQIDPTTQQPFRGTRLIERLGQIHFGGANSAIDSGSSDIHGRLSIYSYGKELAQNYQAALRKKGGQPCTEGNGKVTGKMIYPEGANAPIPGGGYFGADRGDHSHAGLDFSMPIGTPIKAAVLHLVIMHNFSHSRHQPLLVSLDEVRTIYLPDLPKWVNAFRSFGFVPIIGYQNFAQIQEIYGRDASKALFAGCGTKVFFNPRDEETARTVSQYLGEEEVKVQTRSHSYGRNGSTSQSEQYMKRPLLTVEQLLKFDQGECIVINPAFKGSGEASVPIRTKIKLSKRDEADQHRSEELWKLVQQRLEERAADRVQDHDALREALLVRRAIAERLFPLPSKIPEGLDDDSMQEPSPPATEEPRASPNPNTSEVPVPTNVTPAMTADEFEGFV